jgi:hypothetical protein
MYDGSQPLPNSTSGPENNGCATIRRLQKLDLESEDNKSDKVVLSASLYPKYELDLDNESF